MAGKIACFVVLCMVMVAPYASEAFSCGQVQAGVVKCLPYLQNRGPVGQCCDVVKGLLNSAKTTQDRRTTCSCLKSAASIIKGIDMSKAAGLPALCGVKRSSETDEKSIYRRIKLVLDVLSWWRRIRCIWIEFDPA
ncbi:non-specific lipid-transfer protein 2-like [Solanum verrucosum]|uniref:non-specific lipid-transfer protein 2-like n=1 Tax=Solanum verrucosum TaxID=315347 RepID=UPI0020D07707|nr:non-specific lipid-transfer protein 2-like [Solanum verrucosum]